MIKKHYIGKWPAVQFLTLGLIRGQKTLGVLVFSPPPRSIATRYPGEVWELSRLWLDPSVPKNGETFLIGRSIRYVKKEYPQIATLVSFADPEQGHEGIIYKASNWHEATHEAKNLFFYPLRRLE